MRKTKRMTKIPLIKKVGRKKGQAAGDDVRGVTEE